MKWPTTPLGDLCIKIGSGATPRGGNESYKQSGIAFVRSMNVHMGRFKPDDLAFIDETQAAKLNNVVLEKNDVLLNITGASVARCCMLEPYRTSAAGFRPTSLRRTPTAGEQFPVFVR